MRSKSLNSASLLSLNKIWRRGLHVGSSPSRPPSTKVFVWGGGQLGQLGLGKDKLFTQPIQHPYLSSTPLANLTVGPNHCIALTTSGEALAFGRNCSGQLGVGDFIDRFEPTPIPMPTPFSHASPLRPSKVAVGAYHTVVATLEGVILTSGRGQQQTCNRTHQTSINHDNNSPPNKNSENGGDALLRQVDSLRGLHPDLLACGDDFTFVYAGGRLLGFGNVERLGVEFERGGGSAGAR